MRQVILCLILQLRKLKKSMHDYPLLNHPIRDRGDLSTCSFLLASTYWLMKLLDQDHESTSMLYQSMDSFPSV